MVTGQSCIWVYAWAGYGLLAGLGWKRWAAYHHEKVDDGQAEKGSVFCLLGV